MLADYASVTEGIVSLDGPVEGSVAALLFPKARPYGSRNKRLKARDSESYLCSGRRCLLADYWVRRRDYRERLDGLVLIAVPLTA